MKKTVFVLCFISALICACAGGTAVKSPDTADEPASKDDSGAVKAEKTEELEVHGGGRTGAADSGLMIPSEPKTMDKDYSSELKKSSSESSRSEAVSAKKNGGASASGLKASFSDDNKQYGYFINFLDQYKTAKHFPIDISERIVIRVSDSEGKSVANALVKIKSGSKEIASGKTYSDGSFLFFPSEHNSNAASYNCEVTYAQSKKNITISRKGSRDVNVKLDAKRISQKRIPLDLLFIMDTTGSMGEEIARLKQTIEIINTNLASMSAKPEIRFGMILYRDKGDEYVTKVIPLTGDLDAFQNELAKVEANGGGDTPEDLQSALDDAVNKIQWNKDGIRLIYAITDAAPHLDYEQKFSYVDAVRAARKKGVKIFSVGTGGLDLDGEYVLRQISQYTYGKYIFLTYGETGESEGGKEGSVSHHTGANFQTDKLEAIIIKFAKEELSNLSDKPVEKDEEYIEAKKIESEKNEDTLKKLFDMAVSQLVDYSTIKIDPATPVSLIPVIASDKKNAANAEYFTEQANISLAGNKSFKLVERKNLQKILEEIELQNTGITSEESAVKLGKMLGAKILIGSNLYLKSDYYELFIKMYRVETGEILSVNKIRIDKALGLSK
ncbi:MAG: VWA domain-containing protein [Spirochaetes bacterium]|nr:VWA domain-containing protein [Spirochaetota bacterium]